MLYQLGCPSQRNVTQKSHFRELLTNKSMPRLPRLDQKARQAIVSVMKLPAKWIGHAPALIAILMAEECLWQASHTSMKAIDCPLSLIYREFTMEGLKLCCQNFGQPEARTPQV